MYRLLNQFIAGILVCLFININGGLAQIDDFIIKYDTAFTIRDDDGDNGTPDGLPDVIDENPSGPFWGLITSSNFQNDEFFLEFDIRNVEPVTAAKFYFFFSRSSPQLSSGQTIDLTLADYEADGIADTNKFGIGNDFAVFSISNIMDINSIDITDIINSYINSGISHLGLRLYNPISSISPTGIPAQLDFAVGYLNIIPTGELVDMMHPTGAVHAHSNILWPPNNKRVSVKLSGYVLDELSVARDGGGIGVSQAFLRVNNRKIILKDEATNLFDENGRFNINVRLRSNKHRVYRIRLYAADTTPEGPNFGLVDSTIVRGPYNMRGISEDKKFNKNKHK